MSFLKDIVKDIGNEYAGIVSDGVSAGDVQSFIDTGSYVFNALLSGDIYGGLPQNKITALAENLKPRAIFIKSREPMPCLLSKARSLTLL